MKIMDMEIYDELSVGGKLSVLTLAIADLSVELYDTENVPCLYGLIETLTRSLKFNNHSMRLLTGAGA